MQHGAEPQSKVVKDILAMVHDKGQGTGPKDEVGQVLYMRGAMSAMLGVEGIRAAQERFGKGKVDDRRAGALGPGEPEPRRRPSSTRWASRGVMRPISTSCVDHMGASWARIHTWDGSKWNFTSDWLQADEQIIKPLVKAHGREVRGEKKLTPRTPEDCQS